MKKLTIYIFCITFFGCTNKNKIINPKYTLNIINLYESKNRSNDSIRVYKCNINDKMPLGSVLRIKLINPNLLEIKCFSNYGYGGEKIGIIINDSLKINQVTYGYSGDTKEAQNEKYKIYNFNLILNQNPFKDGLDNLKGEFCLEGVIEIAPKSFLDSSIEEKLSDFAYLRCN